MHMGYESTMMYRKCCHNTFIKILPQQGTAALEQFDCIADREY
jgi:hypothetical protein